MTAQLHTNQQPRQLAVNRADIAALVDVIVAETIKRLDAREQHRMISNATKEAVTRHLEQQRTAAKAEPEDIFAGYRINDDTAADYLNSIQESK